MNGRTLLSDQLVEMSNAHFRKLASLSARVEGAQQMGKITARSALEDPYLQKMASKLEPEPTEMEKLASEAAWELLGDDHMEKLAHAVDDGAVDFDELSELEKVALGKVLSGIGRAAGKLFRRGKPKLPTGGAPKPGLLTRMKNRVTGQGWRNTNRSPSVSNTRGTPKTPPPRTSTPPSRTSTPSQQRTPAPAGNTTSTPTAYGKGPYQQPGRQTAPPTPPSQPGPAPGQQAPRAGNRSGGQQLSTSEWEAEAAKMRQSAQRAGSGAAPKAGPGELFPRLEPDQAAAQMRRARFKGSGTRQPRFGANQPQTVGRMASGEKLPTSAVPSGEAVQSLSKGTTRGARKPLMNWKTKALIGTGLAGAGATYLGGKALNTADTFLHQPMGSYQYGMGSPSHFMNPQQM